MGGGAIRADGGGRVDWAGEAHELADERSLSASGKRGACAPVPPAGPASRPLGDRAPVPDAPTLSAGPEVVCGAIDPHGLLDLEVSVPRAGEPTIVWARGEIDLVSAPCLQARLAPLLASGSDVVVDFRDVTFMDGAGVRMLRDAHDLAARTGSVFSIRHPTRLVRRVLEIATETTAVTFLIGDEPVSASEGG
jgi:anti-anti-sigma factor